MTRGRPGRTIPSMIDWKKLNPAVVSEFRENGGKVAQFGDLPVVILHTIGARSGAVREVPLIVIYEDKKMLLFGTAAGASAHPDWYYNLRAHPRIEVELGLERFTADVLELSEDEARKRVEFQAGSVPQFAAYVESAAPRTIPVFSIDPV
jgi:deazaflavin-dependent oxidoreductase (nitroreductase family)